MSELTEAAAANREDFHWRLLSTVSALALMSCVAAPDTTAAESDSNRPTVWMELGGQLSHIDGTGDQFVPDFMRLTPTPSVFVPASPVDAQSPPRFGFGGGARIVILPEDTNLVFSGSITYGRSNGGKRIQKQDDAVILHRSFNLPSYHSYSTYPAALRGFAETRTRQSETHTMVEFMAGKDVGLGMFDRNGSSVVSAGVRFAQFTARSRVDIKARPDLQFYNLVGVILPAYEDIIYRPTAHFHAYTVAGQAARSFQGFGPQISWAGSAPIAGSKEAAEVTLDLGLNAAVLFGRQKAVVNDQNTIHYFHSFHYTTSAQQGGHVTRRSVVVPNVGAFAGLSVNFPNSKVSLGYRGDFFFGAMDVGIDGRKSQTTSFYGPYAKISIGLGG